MAAPYGGICSSGKYKLTGTGTNAPNQGYPSSPTRGPLYILMLEQVVVQLMLVALDLEW